MIEFEKILNTNYEFNLYELREITLKLKGGCSILTLEAYSEESGLGGASHLIYSYSGDMYYMRYTDKKWLECFYKDYLKPDIFERYKHIDAPGVFYKLPLNREFIASRMHKYSNDDFSYEIFLAISVIQNVFFEKIVKSKRGKNLKRSLKILNRYIHEDVIGEIESYNNRNSEKLVFRSKLSRFVYDNFMTNY